MGILDSYLLKNETNAFSNIIYKNKSKLLIPKCKTVCYKTPKGKHRQDIFDINYRSIFLHLSARVMEVKTK